MNSKSNCRHRGKLLFTSLAAATLGLIIMSPDTAKADTLVDAAAKKQGAQSSSLPASNNNQTAASTDSAANNNQASLTSAAAASNKSLTSLDLSNFDTAKVTDMRNMFSNSTSLKTLNISSFKMAQVTSKSEMLKSLPNLSTLVLGPKNYLQGTGLDATGVWLNVGNGTVDKPQGNKRWTSSQLMSNYSGSSDQDTYVRLGRAVTVHYLDETGKKLVEDKILNGKIGDSYNSEPQDIAGYVLKTTPANAKGTYTDKVQEVTYVYTNQVKVLAHYVDQDGEPIADDETLSGKIGAPYPDNAVKDIKGYTLKTKPTGKFSSTETEVTYIYTNQVKVLAH
ncbi:MucBP domain-containing protein, partial [uncultured Lactobacillus sp.]|uniref:MucBP domain-containing protein n=1 Tax=uncultured Lactobacillus sp. TaxID=153152 RepID=UPI0025D802F0